MADYHLSERIVVSRDVLHGKPRIVGSRILVSQILDLLAAGKPISEIISDDYFPTLTVEDVLACLAYASSLVKQETVVPST
jgi:uncharacterized protein (DUF433 family)